MNYTGLIADVPAETQNGPVQLKSLRVGQLIRGCVINESYNVCWTEVRGVRRCYAEPLIRLVFDYERPAIVCPRQMFLTDNKLVPAEELSPGDWLLADDLKLNRVTAVEVLPYMAPAVQLQTEAGAWFACRVLTSG